MRNKNEKVTATIESQSQYKNNKKGEIAMIIEENSPSHQHHDQTSNRTINSSKKADGSLGNNKNIGSRKGSDFNKIL